MSLASALLKRAYIAKCTGLEWSKIEFYKKGNAQHGKPAWLAPLGSTWGKLDFNVSHQAGLVTLVGAYVPPHHAVPGSLASFLSAEDAPEVLVGCDITHTNERNDMNFVRDSTLDSHVSAFDQVFSDEELYDITYTLPSHALTLPSGHSVSSEQLGRRDRTIVCDQDLTVTREDGLEETFSSEMVIDAKLRRFYTFFALKEAYIKLVGEGLLAPWLRNAEFRNVMAPCEGSPMRCSANSAWGGRVMGGGNYGPSPASSTAFAPCKPQSSRFAQDFSFGKSEPSPAGLGLDSQNTRYFNDIEEDDVLYEMTKKFSTASFTSSYLTDGPSLASSRSPSFASTVASTPYSGLSTCSSTTSLATMGSPEMYEPYNDPYDPYNEVECGSPTCTSFTFPASTKTRQPSPLSRFSFGLPLCETPAIMEVSEEEEEQNLELHLHDQEIKDVRMEVQAFEESFMFATMVQPASVLESTKGEFPAWERLNMEKDVVFWARLGAQNQVGWVNGI